MKKQTKYSAAFTRTSSATGLLANFFVACFSEGALLRALLSQSLSRSAFFHFCRITKTIRNNQRLQSLSCTRSPNVLVVRSRLFSCESSPQFLFHHHQTFTIHHPLHPSLPSPSSTTFTTTMSSGGTDFNAIFKNDELAKGKCVCMFVNVLLSDFIWSSSINAEISQLIEKANGLKKSKADDRIRYSRVSEVKCVWRDSCFQSCLRVLSFTTFRMSLWRLRRIPARSYQSRPFTLYCTF